MLWDCKPKVISWPNSANCLSLSLPLFCLFPLSLFYPSVWIGCFKMMDHTAESGNFWFLVCSSLWTGLGWRQKNVSVCCPLAWAPAEAGVCSLLMYSCIPQTVFMPGLWGRKTCVMESLGCVEWMSSICGLAWIKAKHFNFGLLWASGDDSLP